MTKEEILKEVRELSEQNNMAEKGIINIELARSINRLQAEITNNIKAIIRSSILDEVLIEIEKVEDQIIDDSSGVIFGRIYEAIQKMKE